jgi:hypothetical protein
VAAIGWNFFQPVPDDMFGWRLHMADLAINKALAAGGRRQVRDYADLALIHQYMIPLWHVWWAAPGKDESWSPVSLVEKIAATSGFRQADFDADLANTIPLKVAEVLRTLRLDAGNTAPLLHDRTRHPLDQPCHFDKGALCE